MQSQSTPSPCLGCENQIVLQKLSSGYCRPCRDRKYREAHRDQIQARKQRWYIEHRDTLLPRFKANYTANRERESRRSKVRYAARREETIARAAAYAATHREQVRGYKSAYVSRQLQGPNSDRFRATLRDHAHNYHGKPRSKAIARAWQDANRTRLDERRRAWRQLNADKVRDYWNWYRSRKRAAFVAPVSFADIWERDRGICQICHKPVPRDDVNLDHIWPLFHGGTHEPRNVQLTHSACNRGKGSGGHGQLRLLG